jgi:hypothetical protein
MNTSMHTNIHTHAHARTKILAVRVAVAIILCCKTLQRPIGRCCNVQCYKTVGCEFGKGGTKEQSNDRLRRREEEKMKRK